MSILEVHYGVLDGAADSQRRVADALGDVETERSAAVIPAGALGKILESDEIVAEFTDASEATAEALASAIEAAESAAETLMILKEMFSEVDLSIAERFTGMAGG